MRYTGHIANPEISKNKNLYYDVKVQVTKTEYTTIRFMAKGGCPHAEKLRLIKKEEEVKGNRVIFLQKILNRMIQVFLIWSWVVNTSFKISFHFDPLH